MRSAPLRRYATLQPGQPLQRATELSRNAGLRPGGPWARTVPLLTTSTAAKRRPAAGFSPAVRLLVLARAGHGDPDMALCEACGAWTGRHQGDFQHIVARGMGGCKLAVIGSAANCALLCRRCHDLAESRDPHMEAAGFWARQGTDPRLLPMMLAVEGGSGAMVWRSADGRYLLEAPEMAA